jgi:hypothetical protein
LQYNFDLCEENPFKERNSKKISNKPRWTNQKKSGNQSFTKIFAVRRHDTHGKYKPLPCDTLWRTAKPNDH